VAAIDDAESRDITEPRNRASDSPYQAGSEEEKKNVAVTDEEKYSPSNTDKTGFELIKKIFHSSSCMYFNVPFICHCNLNELKHSNKTENRQYRNFYFLFGLQKILFLPSNITVIVKKLPLVIAIFRCM
jgi:hypothetical protein